MSNAIDNYNKCEVVDGVVYDMSPAPGSNHVAVSENIVHIIRPQIKGSLCKIVGENFALFMDEESAKKNTNYVMPDVTMFCDINNNYNTRYYGKPSLIVEVLSDSTRNRDLFVKKDIYKNKGVKEYWTIEYEAKMIDIYYLTDGGEYIFSRRYVLVDDEENENYNAEKEITLFVNKNVKLKLGEIFERVF